MGNQQLKMTDDILQRIVYGMENQKTKLCFDTKNGTLKPESEMDASCIPLPLWGPTEGYQLMDGFVATLHNPVFAQRLRDILASGSGVFRNFKHAVSERHEIEILWRRYKMQKMKRTAISWLGSWSKLVTLENLEQDSEEWENLTPTDFGLRHGCAEDYSLLHIWDRAAQAERFSQFSALTGSMEIQREREGLELSPEETFIAETPTGVAVGFVWISIDRNSDPLEGRLLQVFVVPEYRGMGIARMLIEKGLDDAVQRGAQSLHVAMPESCTLFNAWLKRSGFHPEITTWRKITRLEC